MSGSPLPGFNDLLVGLFQATKSLARRTAEGHGLSLHQAIALDVIRRGTAQPMAVLMEELDLTRGAVSKLVDRLVTLGWVARGAHATDRRAVTLALTPAGAAEERRRAGRLGAPDGRLARDRAGEPGHRAGAGGPAGRDAPPRYYFGDLTRNGPASEGIGQNELVVRRLI